MEGKPCQKYTNIYQWFKYFLNPGQNVQILLTNNTGILKYSNIYDRFVGTSIKFLNIINSSIKITKINSHTWIQMRSKGNKKNLTEPAYVFLPAWLETRQYRV